MLNFLLYYFISSKFQLRLSVIVKFHTIAPSLKNSPKEKTNGRINESSSAEDKKTEFLSIFHYKLSELAARNSLREILASEFRGCNGTEDPSPRRNLFILHDE